MKTYGLFFLVPLLLISLLEGQTGVPNCDFASLIARAKQLIEEQEFTATEPVLRQAVKHNPEDPEATFLLGLVLAKLQKWEVSKELLERAITLQPNFVPAYVELAGVHFKMGKNKESIKILRKVLALDANNSYAQSFLATLLYLEGQQIEALYHWNQVGEPRIAKIAYRISAQNSAQFLQRLFPLNEGEMLRREEILDIQWKQDRFNLGPGFRWQLTPGSGSVWDLEIALSPLVALPFPKAFLLENSARALFYQEIAIGYPKTPGSGRQLSGSFRWDAPRKRVKTSAWFPFLSSSSDGLRLGFDFREETWNHTFSGTKFLFQTEQLFADYEYLMNRRKSLSVHAGYQHQFLHFEGGHHNLPNNPHLVNLGLQWDQLVSLNRSDTGQLSWSARFDMLSGFGLQKKQARQLSSTARLSWQLDDRSETGLKLAFGAGLSSNDLPLAHYFIFGVGQDEPLSLRAHPTVERGRKGNSPMGRNYALANLELHRRLAQWRFVEIGGLLFTDRAIVSGSPFQPSASGWFQDVGWGLRLRVLGRDLLEVLFGFDLKASSLNYWIGLPAII